MDVTDCPDHPQSALRISTGVVCCGCGREVVETPLGLSTRELDPEGAIMVELRAEYTDNRTVAAFVIEARATALGMLESAEDA